MPETPNPNHAAELEAWTDQNQQPITSHVGPLRRPFINPPLREETMNLVKVVMNEDMAISPDGINSIAAKSGQTYSVEPVTAKSLVVEGFAEYADGASLKLQDKIDAGLATANEINPDYGTGPHRDAVSAEQAEDPKVVAERAKQRREKKENANG